MERYSRQILFEGIGEEGQRRLRESRVLVVGCGALGSSQIEMLARAGVGQLRIVDRDFVEESNLQRQTMFTERDARERTPKAVAAARRVAEVNSDVACEALVVDVNQSNMERLVEGWGVGGGGNLWGGLRSRGGVAEEGGGWGLWRGCGELRCDADHRAGPHALPALRL